MHAKLLRILAVGSILGLSSCVGEQSARTADFEADTARQWMQLLHDRVREDGLPPVHAARIYAYGAIALYETAIEGMPDFRSLSTQIPTMPAMPTSRSAEHDWPAAMHAAAALVAGEMLSSAASLAAIEALRAEGRAQRETAEISEDVLQRSEEYGRNVGRTVIAWSRTDGFADTRGRVYTAPTGPDRWAPTPPDFLQTPLEPYWSELRTLALPQTDTCQPPAPVPFSIEPTSAFRAQANDVYQTGRTLTAEQQTIARFWADEPGETGTAPGHWVAILNQLTQDRDLDLEQAVEMYVRVCIVLHDACVSSWEAKYSYDLLRPVTYVQRHMDASWSPFLATPAFPEYPSAHASLAAAASTVLTNLFENPAFTDRTQETGGLAPRSFDSFEAAAREMAVSRLYAGTNYPMSNDNGFTQGQCVGQTLLDRILTRR